MAPKSPRTAKNARKTTQSRQHQRNAGTIPAPQVKALPHAVVDAIFKNDANLRQALTENLKPLRAESEAIANRVQRAFANFNPSPLSPEDLVRRHYVAPGADPGEVLESVIMSGVDALRSSNTDRAITLRKSPELESLIKEAPEPTNSLQGVVALDALVSFVSRKSAGSSLVTEPAYTLCKAELEAEKILGVAEKTPTSANGDGVASLEDTSSDTREADQLVKESVNLQMKSATAPESRLEYASIPNSSDQDKVQSNLLQTFQLRPGASDVTSYHDFHTLQIAFAHVWTQIFDGQLASLGRDLYREYVKLKDFSGSAQPDLQVGTLADLRRLMEEVKKLSQIVQEDLPSDLRGGEGDSKDDNSRSRDDFLEKLGKGGAAVLTGGLSVLFEWALNKFSEMGRKPIIKWDQFPGPWPPRQDKIAKSIVRDVVPTGTVEVVLRTDSGSRIKIIEFQKWDPEAERFFPGPRISNAGRADETSFSLQLQSSEIGLGVLQFASEEISATDTPGRYLLADLAKELTDRTRVTFHWKDS